MRNSNCSDMESLYYIRNTNIDWQCDQQNGTKLFAIKPIGWHCFNTYITSTQKHIHSEKLLCSVTKKKIENLVGCHNWTSSLNAQFVNCVVVRLYLNEKFHFVCTFFFN